MLLTLVATGLIADRSHSSNDARFENAVQSTVDRIRGRLDAYTAMLRGTSGLFIASEYVSRRDFHDYVARLRLQRNFPGVQGIGFSQQVEARGLDSLVAAVRAERGSAFDVYPDTPRPEYTVILYLEPEDERNRVALGYDMFTDPTRREAMIRARDSGSVAMSGRVTLVQEIDLDRQAGFLLYVPVYRARRIPVSVAERRRDLLGYVYSPFRGDDFFRGVFGSERQPRTSFRVYDGTIRSAATLLHDSRRVGNQSSGGGRFSATREMDVYGRTWTIDVTSLPAFEQSSDRWLAPAVALLGTIVSVLLYVVTRSQVRARESAEQTETARARFYAAMSHELRTPINAIIGYNDLLLAEVYGTLEPEQRRAIERGQRAANQLRELVSDVLDVSKLEAGKVTVDRENVHIPTLVDELSATIQPMMEERGCELRRCCEGGDLVIHTDPRRVRQILLNLLSNAAKFGAGRPVELRCVDRGGNGVILEVTDQGPGIAQGDQRRIFEEFVQLPNAAIGGTGLGLPISRRLAVLLGGTLEVHSQLGAGSTFRLSLPR